MTPGVIDAFLRGSGCPKARNAIASLSRREREVVTLLTEGLSNSEIAGRLYLSTGTVKDYVSTVLDKLGAANRVQAAVIAQRSMQLAL